MAPFPQCNQHHVKRWLELPPTPKSQGEKVNNPPEHPKFLLPRRSPGWANVVPQRGEFLRGGAVRKASWSLPWEASRQSVASSSPGRGDVASIAAGAAGGELVSPELPVSSEQPRSGSRTCTYRKFH